MTIDKKELSKLSPQERIKKLKLIGDELKKEAGEIEELIRKSMQDIKTEKIAEEVAPEQRPIDISRLFETTSEQTLERTARDKTPSAALMRGAKGYVTVQQLKYDYTKLKGFDATISMGSSLSEEERALVGQIGERINVAERYITPGEDVASMLDASRTTLRKLKKEMGPGYF